MKTTWNHTPRAHAVFVAGWLWLLLWAPILFVLWLNPVLLVQHFHAAWAIIAAAIVFPVSTLAGLLAITLKIYDHPKR